MRNILKSLHKHFDLFGLRGVLQRGLLSVSGSERYFRARIPNSSGEVILRLGTTDVAAFEHVFVHREYDLSLARDPLIIVDAGANVGMSAVFFAQRYPKAKIIAVEPDAKNFAVLLKNSQLFPCIVPVNAALWNSDGIVSMHDGGGGSWGMQVREDRAPAVTVRSITLRTLLEEYAIEHVDLLKLDVEGAECEILQSASGWINHVSAICAELHDRFRPGCERAFNAATVGFQNRWRRGELSCVAREVGVYENLTRVSR